MVTDVAAPFAADCDVCGARAMVAQCCRGTAIVVLRVPTWRLVWLTQAVRTTLKLEVPIVRRGALMVSPEYIEWLVELANEKMTENFSRIDKYFAAFRAGNFDREEASPAPSAAPVLSGPYACTFCSAGFPSRNKLMAHAKALHAPGGVAPQDAAAATS
eukprot:m.55149 g.55149  ORF g.55149 m.55149 type:complete len:159 (+) comp6653_c0_seq2:462-938(+)